MTNDEYIALQSRIFLLAGFVRTMDLSAFLSRIDHADALGPMLDPTLYRDAMGNLACIRRIAYALEYFKSEMLAAIAALPPNERARLDGGAS